MYTYRYSKAKAHVVNKGVFEQATACKKTAAAPDIVKKSHQISSWFFEVVEKQLWKNLQAVEKNQKKSKETSGPFKTFQTKASRKVEKEKWNRE